MQWVVRRQDGGFFASTYGKYVSARTLVLPCTWVFFNDNWDSGSEVSNSFYLYLCILW